jgi:formylglycine-generating enzyme required for sulfatase activity
MGAYVGLESEVDLRRHDNSRPGNSDTEDMVRIFGGTFRMGSDKNYPEEAPVHRVTVGDFWIDRTPITNRQFKEFVNATRHVTFAEIPPDPKDYPGALPEGGSHLCAPNYCRRYRPAARRAAGRYVDEPRRISMRHP